MGIVDDTQMQTQVFRYSGANATMPRYSTLLRPLVKRGLTGQELADKAGWFEPTGLPMTANCAYVHVHALRQQGYSIKSRTGTNGRILDQYRAALMCPKV